MERASSSCIARMIGSSCAASGNTAAAAQRERRFVLMLILRVERRGKQRWTVLRLSLLLRFNLRYDNARRNGRHRYAPRFGAAGPVEHGEFPVGGRNSGEGRDRRADKLHSSHQ